MKNVVQRYLILMYLFVGGTYNEALVPAIGKTSLIARAQLVIGDRKVEAISHMNSAMSGRFVEFRVIDASIGFPTISVVDNISSWKVGEKTFMKIITLLLASG